MHGQKVSDVVKNSAKLDVLPNRGYFDIAGAYGDDKGEDVNVPLVCM